MIAKQYIKSNAKAKLITIILLCLFSFVFIDIVLGCVQYCGSPTAHYKIVKQECTVDDWCTCSGIRISSLYYSCDGSCPWYYPFCKVDTGSSTTPKPTLIEESCSGNCMTAGGCDLSECNTATIARYDFVDIHTVCYCSWTWW